MRAHLRESDESCWRGTCPPRVRSKGACLGSCSKTVRVVVSVFFFVHYMTPHAPRLDRCPMSSASRQTHPFFV